MKKLSYLLFPLTLLSFSQAIHAQNDASAIVISQSITNTPDANGQYTATIEAFVKGESSGNPEYVSVTIQGTIYEFLGKNSYKELYDWVVSSYDNNTERTLGSQKFKYFKKLDLYYDYPGDTPDKGAQPLYIAVQKSFNEKQDDSNYYTFYYGDLYTSKVYSNFSPAKDSPIYQANTTFTDKNAISGIKRISYPWNAKYDALGEASTISETFDGFLIPQNPTITIKSADCDGAPGGNPSFSTTMNDASATVSPSTDRKSITISGFDFSGNACGNDGSANHGKKLIVTFPVIPCYNTAVNFENSHSFLTSSSVTNNSRTEVKSGMFSALGQLPNLTVSASGTDIKATDNFIFTVTGPTQLPEASRKTFKVMIQGGNSVTLKAIPAGTYSIIADSWPWTYTVDDGSKSVTTTMDLSSPTPSTASATFTFTPNSITTPHHGEATASTPAN